MNETVHVRDFSTDNDRTVNLFKEVDGIYYGTTVADYRLSQTGEAAFLRDQANL